MTTKPLLPGLTRHFYEARREVLALAGITATPWYQLTGDERKVAEAEADIVREALRRVAAEHFAITALTLRTNPVVPEQDLDHWVSRPSTAKV